MQKLVTIYLDNHAYIGDKWVKSSYADKHGYVEEHLRAELQEGWRIVSLFGFGGAGRSTRQRLARRRFRKVIPRGRFRKAAIYRRFLFKRICRRAMDRPFAGPLRKNFPLPGKFGA